MLFYLVKCISIIFGVVTNKGVCEKVLPFIYFSVSCCKIFSKVLEKLEKRFVTNSEATGVAARKTEWRKNNAVKESRLTNRSTWSVRRKQSLCAVDVSYSVRSIRFSIFGLYLASYALLCVKFGWFTFLRFQNKLFM